MAASQGVRKKKPEAEKVPAKEGRPAAKKVPAKKGRPAKKVPAKRGRPAKNVVPAQKKERPVRKKAAPPQRKDTETEEETESEQELVPETDTKIIFEKEKLELLERFCVYAVKFYIPFFLTANIGADAAVTLYKKLKKFSQVDKELADEAVATLSCHLWFLAPTSAVSSSPSPVRSWRTISDFKTEGDEQGIANLSQVV